MDLRLSRRMHSKTCHGVLLLYLVVSSARVRRELQGSADVAAILDFCTFGLFSNNHACMPG